jgi:arylsulfatase A-like enzyme
MQSERLSAVDVFVPALWLAVVTGLGEGIGFWGLQQLGWLSWELSLDGISVEIIWIAVAANLVLLSTLAVAFLIAGRWLQRSRVLSTAVFVFVFWLLVDWLILLGRLRHRSLLLLAAGLATVFLRWFRQHEAQALRFWRRTLPWLAAAAVLALVGIEGGLWLRERWALAKLPPAPAGAPNVLVIVIDTLRSDHLSAYGYSRPTSPNLDRLAQEGVLFENAFATSSWTVPSHASLLTGRYPHEHGAETGRQPLDGRYPTLAEALRDRGYRTAAFSANTLFFTRRLGFGRGFLHFEDYFQSVADMAARTIAGRKFNRYVRSRLGWTDLPARRRAADINRNTIRWIDRDRNRPFFAFLNYFDPHAPYLPPDPYLTKFSTTQNLREVLATIGFSEFDLKPRLSPSALQAQIDGYDGAIAYVDDYLGQLLSELRERRLTDNTLVVITSDHGEALGEHGLLGHRKSLYRSELQVPLLVWWPSRIPGGVRTNVPVSIAAIPATIAILTGGDSRPTFPGRSLTELWTDPASSGYPLPLAELTQLPFGSQKYPTYHGWLKSLVTPEWHYILHERFGPELYQWPKDMMEENNLSKTAAGAATIREFSSCLETILAGGSDQAKESCGKVSARSCCGDSSSPGGLAASVSSGRR